MKLDGEVGIIGNGAGLVMSTLDAVSQAGGRSAKTCCVTTLVNSECIPPTGSQTDIAMNVSPW